MTEKKRKEKQPAKGKQPEQPVEVDTPPTRGTMAGAISYAVTAVHPALGGNMPGVSAVVAWLEFGLQIADEAPILASVIRRHLATAPRPMIPEVPEISVGEFILALESVMIERGLLTEEETDDGPEEIKATD